jgi:cyclopropane-fatty-acyl-phospholipid synthase
MIGRKRTVERLFELCDVKVNGQRPWDIRVNDERMYDRVLRDKRLGLGESYMDGWWDCTRLDELICRILTAGVDQRVAGSVKLLLPAIQAKLSNRQSLQRSKTVAERHYDLGNDLFLAFLDSNHQYSCAYFNGTDDLDRAQINKMELTCRKLDLHPGERVLDIGSGWGGLAKYMAEKHRVSVTGINISERQIDYARELCRDLTVEIINKDYRDVDGTFDKVVSVGMFEHVGRKNYRTFMEAAYRCLGDNGVFLLHTIGNNKSQLDTDPWMEKYIFPNGELPSIRQISEAVEGLFVVEDLHNMGPHYDRTLMSWHERFQKAWPALKDRYDERFKRMWEYYLLSCAGAFRARDIQLWQIVMTKAGTPQPPCRF